MSAEQFYAFKLGFAWHMVQTRGWPCDLARLRRLQEEALNMGVRIQPEALPSIRR
jgi:hypothetical protein